MRCFIVLLNHDYDNCYFFLIGMISIISNSISYGCITEVDYLNAQYMNEWTSNPANTVICKCVWACLYHKQVQVWRHFLHCFNLRRHYGHSMTTILASRFQPQSVLGGWDGQWCTGGGGFKPPPEIPKALQNRAKLNLIVKTVKNCWI